MTQTCPTTGRGMVEDVVPGEHELVDDHRAQLVAVPGAAATVEERVQLLHGGVAGQRHGLSLERRAAGHGRPGSGIVVMESFRAACAAPAIGLPNYSTRYLGSSVSYFSVKRR